MHNQECQYLLSKKRQASKNSLESAGSGKGSGFRLQLNDVCNTMATYTSEAPNSVRISPGLPSPPTDNLVQIFADTIHNDSSKRTPNSDQSTVHTFGDEYAEDPTWNIEIDPEGIQSLLPTTDIEKMFDLSEFTWPPFMTDSSSQLDFDIPFTADQNDVALNLNLKMTTKSFLGKRALLLLRH